jgi:hypothetical protein
MPGGVDQIQRPRLVVEIFRNERHDLRRHRHLPLLFQEQPIGPMQTVKSPPFADNLDRDVLLRDDVFGDPRVRLPDQEVDNLRLPMAQRADKREIPDRIG